ncbi:MAG: BatD family protein [Imperialibacter sp.]|uniref:BatD family protein n=1 Tax=Imperialibacter sp. TaxID=2038411 RepID=UPI0032EF9590
MRLKSFAKTSFLIAAAALLILEKSYSQEISVDLGPSEMALNQYFTITVTVQNDRLRSYDEFPEISGFVKRGTSSSTSTNFINGKMSSTQSITQNYAPQREGSFRLQPFTITVNGEKFKSEGQIIKVGPPVNARRQQADPFGADPFEDFFGRKSTPNEFVDIKDEAFLALTTDKDEVFVGEGFTTTLAFYVAEENKAPLQFYELGKQLTDIVKKVKPANTWEENYNIENVQKEPVTINGKRYSQYKLYQATYYPLNLDDIKFPSVGLELIKYKVAKNPTFFGQNRMEDYKTFSSKEKVVAVKDLPPHPLKQTVPVGKYRLQEEISSTELNTGDSFNYSFIVAGEGNISAINKPQVAQSKAFDFYDPNVKQSVNRNNGKVRGTKTFNYFGIPNEPGGYKLSDYFQMVFFNPEEAKYDTLKSRVELVVKGESRRNEYISSSDLGSFYDRIGLEENTLVKLSSAGSSRIFANVFILIMLALTAALYVKRK